MKVLNVVYNFNTGGVERLIIDVSNELIRRGTSTSVCIINNSYTKSLLNAIDKNVNVFFLKKYGKVHQLQYLKQLVKIVKENKIDVIHVHQGNLMKFFALVKIFCPRTRIYYTVHDTRIFFELSKVDRLISKLICNKLIVISDAVKKDVLLGKIPERKIERVYNGVNFNRFRIGNCKSEKIVISNVARFVPHKKGQDILIEAIKILKKKGLNIKCNLAGAPCSAEDREYINAIAEIEKDSLEDTVQLLGNVSDVPSLLENTDIFVIPSRFEGFGIAAVEAAAAGLPCVASDIDGLSEVVNDVRLGRLFESGNAQSLADNIYDVILRLQSFDSSWIRNNAYNRFSIQKMVDSLLEIYER